ncbi:MAG: DUF721 domain-containing protein [Bacteroidota bacterium]
MARSVRREARGRLQSLGDAIREAAAGLGIARRLEDHMVVAMWERCVGEQIARVAVARKMENGVLTVHVRTAPWRAELTLRRRAIAARINSELGRDLVKDIRFR